MIKQNDMSNYNKSISKSRRFLFCEAEQNGTERRVESEELSRRELSEWS